jgi:hypothetical protein
LVRIETSSSAAETNVFCNYHINTASAAEMNVWWPFYVDQSGCRKLGRLQMPGMNILQQFYSHSEAINGR